MTDFLIAGSNPCIFLYQDMQDEILLALSYWDISYSPVGSGKCLFLNSNHPSLCCKLCLADNESLPNLVHSNFNKHFSGFKELNDSMSSPQTASFGTQHMPKGNEFCLKADAASVSLAASWCDLGDAEQIIDQLSGFGTLGDQRFSVSSVIVPAARAKIFVNGSELRGRIKPSYGKLKSSAFLAWAESWSLLCH